MSFQKRRLAHEIPIDRKRRLVSRVAGTVYPLAEAFSHKPQALSYEDDGSIWQNVTLPGYLYVIDEPVVPGRDVAPHPRSTMDANVEFLTKRPLRVRCIAEVPL